MRTRKFLLLGFLLVLMAACGNKGPLVAPDEKPAQPESAASK
jgi:predicted small lipoprotein YifL